MSKLTNREYRNIAKRPAGDRGHGFAARRPVVETPVEELLREAEEDLTELGEGMGEVTVGAQIESTVRPWRPDSEPTFGKTFEQPQSLGSIDGSRSVRETAPKKKKVTKKATKKTTKKGSKK